MKKLIIFLMCLLVVSCSGRKYVNSEYSVEFDQSSKCPDSGHCDIKINKRKSILTQTDEYGNLSYTLQDNDATDVVVMIFDKEVPVNVQDANYREEVILEMPQKRSASVITNLDSQKILFGRFCYCKGSTGYYKVRNGELRIKAARAPAATSVSLTFSVTEVPQLIKSIHFFISHEIIQAQKSQ